MHLPFDFSLFCEVSEAWLLIYFSWQRDEKWGSRLKGKNQIQFHAIGARDCGYAAYRGIDLRRDNKAAIFTQVGRRIKWLHARGAQYQDSPGVRPKVRVTKQLMMPLT